MLIDGNEIDSIGDYPQVSISGNTQAGAVVDGPFEVNGSIETDPKLIVMKLLDFPGDDTSMSTGYSTADWNCAVGSFQYLNGDIQENDSGHILRAYTYRENYVWRVYADFRSHNNHEDHKVGVVCFRTGISSVSSWF